MEEPPHAASASADAATPEENAAQEEKPRRQRWRFRVPTSLLVTVLVALLTVWIAPAFTRQWEDRRKARDMQAATAEWMSAASGDALGQTLSLAGTPDSDAAVNRVRKDWLVARYRIQARVDAYFSPLVSGQWRAHGELVTRVIDVAWVADDAERGTFWCDQSPRHGRCVRKFAVNQARQALNNSVSARKEEGDVSVYMGFAGQDEYSLEGSRRFVELNASPFILQSLGWVTESVLDESPRGFSTTRGELLRDLLP